MNSISTTINPFGNNIESINKKYEEKELERLDFNEQSCRLLFPQLKLYGKTKNFNSQELNSTECEKFLQLVKKINDLIPDYVIKSHLCRLNHGSELGWEMYQEAEK